MGRNVFGQSYLTKGSILSKGSTNHQGIYTDLRGGVAIESCRGLATCPVDWEGGCSGEDGGDFLERAGRLREDFHFSAVFAAFRLVLT